MADSQEIYIRNPLAVLNVDLCGMQAPRLLRAVLFWIPSSAGDRKANGSLSKVTVTLANYPQHNVV